MGYTLWRNGQLLGEIVLLFPSSSADQVQGMFAPSDDFSDIAPLMQVRHALAGDERVFEARFTGSSKSVTMLQPMSPEEARGLPAESVLELRDDQGELVPRQMIAIQTFSIGPHGHAADESRKHGDTPTGWMLFAADGKQTKDRYSPR
jgi:hypothetical protein